MKTNSQQPEDFALKLIDGLCVYVCVSVCVGERAD